MPLFLVTLLFSEGMYETDFQVVAAASRLATVSDRPQVIARHMLEHPQQRQKHLHRADPRDWRDSTFAASSFWDGVHDPQMTTQQLLERIELTSIDGDSGSQLRIFVVNEQSLSEVDTNSFRGKTSPIVRLGCIQSKDY